MQYAILCYHDEKVTCAWSKEHDDAVMAKLGAVMGRVERQDKLGQGQHDIGRQIVPGQVAGRHEAAIEQRAVGELLVREKREQPLVIDGPFAETKEQLLGFYVVDCASLEEAIEITKELGAANPGGAHEIRPVGAFFPGKTAP